MSSLMWGQGIPYLVDTVNNQGADDSFWYEYGAEQVELKLQIRT